MGERIINFIKNLFNSQGDISSKRFCGFIGWMIVIGITIYCTTSKVQAPQLSYDLLYVSAALLGLDSVTNIFRRK
nr:MAG TPA: hypothetical protein [Caudoviricetes sp.]